MIGTFNWTLNWDCALGIQRRERQESWRVWQHWLDSYKFRVGFFVLRQIVFPTAERGQLSQIQSGEIVRRSHDFPHANAFAIQ